MTTFACCECCSGAAQNDHVDHGGPIEVNGHEIPCGRHQGADVDAAHNAALDEIATRFREEATPSTTGVWREAVNLLDRLIEEAKR